GEIVEWDSTRDQPLEDAGPLPLGLLEMLDPHLEVAAVGIDRPERQAVAEDHLQVDNVRRDLDLAIARRHTGEAEDAVGPELGHRRKRDLAVARPLEDEVDLTEFILDARQRVIRDAFVAGAEA